MVHPVHTASVVLKSSKREEEGGGPLLRGDECVCVWCVCVYGVHDQAATSKQGGNHTCAYVNSDKASRGWPPSPCFAK